ncbi:MAG: rhodanese-like domain-containing protein [Thiotrichaceae bacterium]
MISKTLGHFNSAEACVFLTENPDAKLIDIRSSMEFLFIGHPVGCTHLPWMEDPDWDINPNFEAEIKSLQINNCPIVMICRSGNRSEKAGVQLLEAGLDNIYHITDGFEGDRDEKNHRGSLNGWRFHGLPWEQC